MTARRELLGRLATAGVRLRLVQRKLVVSETRNGAVTAELASAIKDDALGLIEHIRLRDRRLSTPVPSGIDALARSEEWFAAERQQHRSAIISQAIRSGRQRFWVSYERLCAARASENPMLVLDYCGYATDKPRAVSGERFVAQALELGGASVVATRSRERVAARPNALPVDNLSSTDQVANMPQGSPSNEIIR